MDRAYRLCYENSPDGLHQFCGESDLAGAWCYTCNKRLLHVLTLSPADNALRVIEIATPLFVCWTCDFIQAPFSYSFDANSISLIEARRGGSEHDFPYPSYPEFFPGSRATLMPLPTDFLEKLQNINAGSYKEDYFAAGLMTPKHQVGGIPLLRSFREESVSCPKCGEEMPFLAAVANDNLDERGFTENPFVQVLYFLCSRCRVIAGQQDTD